MVHPLAVALRKESVDRNTQRRDFKRLGLLSLSARRAWIEIIDYIIDYVNDAVALRKESVDRNVNLRVLDGSRSSSLSARRAWIEIILPPVDTSSVKSLSARRAWIEIPALPERYRSAHVALRKESVDRNC